MNLIDSGEYIRVSGLRQNNQEGQMSRLPSFPLTPVIMIKGEAYDFIFGYDTNCGCRMNNPRTVWENTMMGNNALEGYLATWFPAGPKNTKPQAVKMWNWQGLTEVFSLQESGCCLKDVFIHAGDNEFLYYDYMGVKPKKIHDNPLVMQYQNIMVNCIGGFNGKLLLGHGRHNNILNKYDMVIEAEVSGGRLTMIQDVTQLVKSIKQWMLNNLEYTMDSLLQNFPGMLTNRLYWFQK